MVLKYASASKNCQRIPNEKVVTEAQKIYRQGERRHKGPSQTILSQNKRFFVAILKFATI